jgi:hypothetical protein
MWKRIMPAESELDGVAGAATGRQDSLQDGEELLGAGGSEDEGEVGKRRF